MSALQSGNSGGRIQLRSLASPRLESGQVVWSSRERNISIDAYRTVLVIGGSKSGKSKHMEVWAEEAASFYGGDLIYLACMEAGNDPENLERIERHKRQRAGRGFRTCEIPFNLSESLELIPRNSVVLLECLGTLLANELFSPGNRIRQETWTLEGKMRAEEVVQTVLADLDLLRNKTRLLILAANNVFEDALDYDPATNLWIETLGLLCQKIAKWDASLSLEVHAGIPIVIGGCDATNQEKRR